MKQPKTFKILAAADIHGSSELAQKLSEKAKKNKVDLVVLAGDIHGALDSENIIKPFKKNNQKLVFIPGNWDSTLEAELLSSVYNIKNIDGRYVIYDGIGIIGIGNPDMKFSLDEKRISKDISKNFELLKSKTRKKVLVSHLHAEGTKAEFSGIRGDRILKKAIDYFHPDILISAHIHEAEGIEEKIGKTRVIQVGREGKIIEL